MVVKSILENNGLTPTKIELGEVCVTENNISSVKNNLINELNSVGFDLLDNTKSKIIEQIKSLIINLVHKKNNSLNTTLSEYIISHIPKDYNSLSKLFSEVEGTTIEKYYILQKIEKVKELIVYDELSLSEITHKLNYSSVAHLSGQFKKVTGLTPSYFKKTRNINRISIEKI